MKGRDQMAKKKSNFPPMRHPGKGFHLEGRFNVNGRCVRIYLKTKQGQDDIYQVFYYWNKDSGGKGYRYSMNLFDTSTPTFVPIDGDPVWTKFDEDYETLSGACYVVLNMFARR